MKTLGDGLMAVFATPAQALPAALQMHEALAAIVSRGSERGASSGLRGLRLQVAVSRGEVVEDDWESPTLGAWGLGWEVWLDGMEISQFTYFQQVGGVRCQPVSVELTYGLLRLCMFIQGVNHVKDLLWGGGLTWGEVQGQFEREYSAFNFEHADIELYRRFFDDREREARQLLEAGLVYPGYDAVIKCSHFFNVLEARGAVDDRVDMPEVGYHRREQVLHRLFVGQIGSE